MFKAEPLNQDWGSHLPRYWNDNSPFKTHFFNALSISLPDCEKFFIETVAAYSKNIDNEKFKLEIKEFLKQESHHRHAHKKYNDWLQLQGLPVEQLQNNSRKTWRLISSKLGNQNKLAITICIEHITVVYSCIFLQHKDLLKNMHPHFKQIWQWHAIEELEHKSVTVDIWNSANGSTLHKNLVMSIVLLAYMWYVGKNTIIFLHKDHKLLKIQTWYDMIHFLFNRQYGLLRKSSRPWFDFMKSDFHPSDHNHDNLLIEYSKL